jgi:hypothetical protein
MDSMTFNLSSELSELRKTLERDTAIGSMRIKPFQEIRSTFNGSQLNFSSQEKTSRLSHSELDELTVFDIPETSIRISIGSRAVGSLINGFASGNVYEKLEKIGRDMSNHRACAFASPVFLPPAEPAVVMKLVSEGMLQSSTTERIRSERELINGYKEAQEDLNYSAYISEVEELAAEFGNCVVAFARGKRIAVARDVTELIDKIPEEYDDEEILIQKVPDRALNIRESIRVSS